MNVIVERKGRYGLYVDSELCGTWDPTTARQYVLQQAAQRGLGVVQIIRLRGEGFSPRLSDQERANIVRKFERKGI